jgi:(1->4)-alpha-D-glucan 1-alpha-D-glucosylmutase
MSRFRQDWSDTTIELPRGQWRSVLTDEVVNGCRIPVAALLRRFPVALLVRKEDQHLD